MKKPGVTVFPYQYGSIDPTVGETVCRYRGSDTSNMVVTFITQDQDGFHTYTGHVVSRGPTTIVVLLTEPFSMAGRSVQFPIATVVEEKVVSV